MAYFHLLQLRAENLVSGFWPEVKAAAKRLLSEKTLTSKRTERAAFRREGNLHHARFPSEANGPSDH